MKRRLLTFFVILLLLLQIIMPLIGSAQSIDKLKEAALNTRKLTLAHGDSVEVFQLAPAAGSSPVIAGDGFYWWYGANSIQRTQGAAAGRLLDGAYSLFTREKALVEQGIYEQGQRKGLWRQWHKTGTLKSREYWKKGLREGKFEQYYPNGKMLKEGKYRRDKLVGVIKSYDEQGELTKSRYTQGELKQPKEKKSKQKKQLKKKREKPEKQQRLKSTLKKLQLKIKHFPKLKKAKEGVENNSTSYGYSEMNQANGEQTAKKQPWWKKLFRRNKAADVQQ